MFFAAESETRITARGDFFVLPHYSIQNHPEIDVLLIPGGVHTQELKKKHVIDWIAETSPKTSITASVCTGAFLLAEAGLLSGLSATTHWEDILDLEQSYPQVTVLKNKRWVDEGRIITSGGISAGIDMSLHLLSRLFSMELAERTARQMEFRWLKTETLL